MKTSSQSDDTTSNALASDAFPVVFKPVWGPFGEEAEKVVDRLIKEAQWPTTGPKAIKYRVVVASFLKAAQELYSRHSHNRNDKKEVPHLGVRWRNDAWSAFPLVGKDVANMVIRELLQQFDAKQVEGSGSSNLVKDEQGKWTTDPKMSMYEIHPSKVAGLSTLRFIETGLPRIKVNKAESRRQRDARRADKKAKPFLKNTKGRLLFGDLHRTSESRIERLNTFWCCHPLILPNGHAAASATRVYHDGRMDAGGRLYGAWTGLKKNKQGIKERLYCNIAGQPVCELDIRASQPTLFSTLLGYRMAGKQPGDAWEDAYAELTKLWAIHYDWPLYDPLISPMDLIKRNRNVAKAVVMELIGSGNHVKSRSSEALADKFGLTAAGWKTFREKIIDTMPALEELEARYNRDGALAGYKNGAGFLSYHESEIMLLTLERLIDLGMPAYPIHDCLTIKISDAKQAAYVFRDTIREYCKNMSGLEVLVPLGIEVLEHLKSDVLPDRKDLIGKYLN